MYFENECMDIYSKFGKLVNLVFDDSVYVSIVDLMYVDMLKVVINKCVYGSKFKFFFVVILLVKLFVNVFDVV